MKTTFFRHNILTILMLLFAFSGSFELNAQPQLLWEQQLGNAEYHDMEDVEFCENGDLLITSRLLDDFMMLDRVAPNGTQLWSTETTGQSGRDLEWLGSNRFATTYVYSSGGSQIAVFDLGIGLEYITDTIFGAVEAINRYDAGGYLTSGAVSSSDPFVSRIDSVGSIVWYSQLGGTTAQYCNGVTSSISNSIFAAVTSYAVIPYKLTSMGSVVDSVEIFRQNIDALHVAFEADILPDGNLFLSGMFSLEPDLSYSGILLSPDLDVITYWGYQEYWSPTHYLYSMPDGGSISHRIHNFVFIEFTRYDATGNPLITWNYVPDVADLVESVSNLTIITSPSGEIYVLGEYSDGEYTSPDVFAAKFGAWHTDLEIAVNRYGDMFIPAPGRFFWHGTLTNNTEADITTDVWVIVRGPDGYPSEPLRVWEDITIPANGTYEADLRQNVPADATSGEYNYIVRAGTYEPGNPQHTIQAYFPLTVTGGTEVNLDPPRVRGVVAAPFEEPELVEISPELKTTD